MTRAHNFTRKIRAAAIERANGKCQQCNAAMKPGEAEVDHILPVAMGGESVISNARAICKVCHKAKTADDVRAIRKSDRQRDKASGAIRPKQSLKSRGFEKPERKHEGRTALPPRPLYQERIG